MSRILKETFHKAKKDYVCNACEVLLQEDNFEQLCISYGLNDEEIQNLTKAKENDYMIKKGDIYLYQAGTYYGDFYSVKLIPEIHNICLKRGFYNED